MKREIRFLLIMIIAIAGALSMTACNPVLSLNPEYTYTYFELNLGDKISDDIGEYVDMSRLTAEEADFVRDNTELLYDGEPIDDSISETGDHTLTINYCGSRYREYQIKITDKVPPVFTEKNNIYTFVGLSIDESMIDDMFTAEDNSGSCEITIDKSDIDYNTAGKYVMTATATDPSGNTATAKAKVIVQEPRYGAKGTYVYVSISDQTLTYFVDGEVVLSTPVVTGNSWNHATPRGTFRILSKATNVTLKGREDNGDKYESFVYYWMAFIGGVYGLHDATWRGSFGGNIYQGNGSHGCVNMPYGMAAELFSIIDYGTPVLIY